MQAEDAEGGKSAESADSDDEKLPEEKYLEKLAKEIPQGTDKTPEVLSGALHGLSDRLLLLYLMHNQRN